MSPMVEKIHGPHKDIRGYIQVPQEGMSFLAETV
jgi:hypothetical protein